MSEATPHGSVAPAPAALPERTPGSRLRALVRSLYEADEEFRSLRTARRKSRIECREEIRQAKKAVRAQQDEIARQTELQRARDKAEQIKLDRQSRQPLIRTHEHPLLVIVSSRHMTVNAVLAYLGIFLLPVLGIGSAAYAIWVHTGGVDVTIVLGSAGGTGAMLAMGFSVLSYRRRAGKKNAVGSVQTPNNAKPRQDDKVADPPESGPSGSSAK
ncbi:hypothetical protein OHA70_17660 [Kribbella sp. NBC_00382]|uniref:hypothetical protein n=1 Tax=Kribbella sp. NBC_00382 TaxID=2975967 RepID=UPI002E1ADD9F